MCAYDDSIDMIYEENNTEILKFADKKITFSTIEMNSSIATTEEKSTGLFTADSEITLVNTDNKKENVYTTSDVTKEIYSKRRYNCIKFGFGAAFC